MEIMDFTQILRTLRLAVQRTIQKVNCQTNGLIAQSVSYDDYVWIASGSRSVLYLARQCIQSEVDCFKSIINVIACTDGSVGIHKYQAASGLGLLFLFMICQDSWSTTLINAKK